MSESETEQVATPTGEAAGLAGAEAAAPAESQETDWVAEARKWEKRAKENASKLKEAEPRLSEYDRLVAASKTEEERAKDAAAAAQARVEQLTNRAVMAEVKALAASSFADPTDASAFIDPKKYVTSDGDVDTEAIKADLSDLLSRKPHLGKPAERNVPAPNPAQGSSANGAPAPAQLSESDVKRLFAEKRYDEIEAARQEGRLSTILGAQ